MQKEKRREIIERHQAHEGDTGSTGVQIAILTERINQLTGHMRAHKHDYATQRGLLMLVGKRRRLLRYLQSSDPQSYKSLISQLKIRAIS